MIDDCVNELIILYLGTNPEKDAGGLCWRRETWPGIWMVTLKVELILSLDLQFNERTGEEGIEKKIYYPQVNSLGKVAIFLYYAFTPTSPVSL